MSYIVIYTNFHSSSVIAKMCEFGSLLEANKELRKTKDKYDKKIIIDLDKIYTLKMSPRLDKSIWGAKVKFKNISRDGILYCQKIEENEDFLCGTEEFLELVD